MKVPKLAQVCLVLGMCCSWGVHAASYANTMWTEDCPHCSRMETTIEALETETAEANETETTEANETNTSSSENGEIPLRIHIPNPPLNNGNPEELIKRLIRNRKLKHRNQDVGTSENSVYTKGNWKDGCLANGTKFSTLNLIPKSTTTTEKESSEDEDDKNSGSSHDIRINKYYAGKRDRFYARNSGDGTFTFKLEPEKATSQATIRGPNWGDEYVLAQGHVYWSFDNNHGAQHAIKGQPFALEVQLVHYKKASGSVEDGAKADDGLVVSSLLFEATGNPNPHIEPLAGAARSCLSPNKHWKQVHGPLDLKMLYPVDMTYVSYNGAYINQPCAKNATYLVFQTPMAVSYSQLTRFRELRKLDTLPNFMGTFLTLSASDGSNITAISSGPKTSLNIVNKEVLNKSGTLHDHNSTIYMLVLCTGPIILYNL